MIKSLPLNIHSEEFSNNHIVAYSLEGQPIYWAEMQERLNYWEVKLRDISQNNFTQATENWRK